MYKIIKLKCIYVYGFYMKYKNFLFGLLIIGVSFGMLGVTVNTYETENKMDSYVEIIGDKDLERDSVNGKEFVSFTSLSKTEQTQFMKSLEDPVKENADSFTDKYTYIQYENKIYKTEYGEYIVGGILPFLFTLGFLCIANIAILDEKDLSTIELNGFLLRFYGLSITVFSLLLYFAW